MRSRSRTPRSLPVNRSSKLNTSAKPNWSPPPAPKLTYGGSRPRTACATLRLACPQAKS